MAEVTGAELRWPDALAAWAVPSDILAQAPERPYVWPTSRFKRTDDPALAALPTGRTVLDVGVGVGWASLWLAPPATRIIGVDPDPAILAAFSRAVKEKASSIPRWMGAGLRWRAGLNEPTSALATTSSTTFQEWRRSCWR